MEVVTIEQAQEEAKVEWKEYCRAIRENVPDDAEYMKYYKSIKNALYYLSQGKHIIDLQASMKAAGLNEKNQPRLAIAKANIKEVHFEWNWDGEGEFYESLVSEYWGWENHRVQAKINRSVWGLKQRGFNGSVKTIVPKVPAHLLPKYPLHNYFILWEVEEWTPEPPRDPMLLKKIRGNKNLYAVLAVWDLSELERAVLRGAVM